MKPIACSKWRELFSQLQERRLLTSIDWDLLALYCDAWQSLSDADAEVQRNGTYFETEKGYIAIHPAKLARDKAVAQIQKLGDRLGLGINSRRGLKLRNPEDEGDDADPLDAYSKRK